MKVVKELPISIYTTLRLLLIPLKKLKKENKKTAPVTVSLTSIPSRFNTLHLVLRSLMFQDVRPKKIILWLNEEFKESLPKSLKRLECDFFEIRFSKLTCSHRKLVHSLKAFPNEIIITCDDDLMYRKNWLSLLYKEHKKNPDKIIGNHTVHINHDENKNPLSFKKWKYPVKDKVNPMAITPIGAWGVLYPPHSLSTKTTDEKLFLKLTPKADDLWFKAMALLEGTMSIQAKSIPKEPIPISGTQKISLKKSNLGMDKNTEQWSLVSNYFKLNKIILSN